MLTNFPKLWKQLGSVLLIKYAKTLRNSQSEADTPELRRGGASLRVLCMDNQLSQVKCQKLRSLYKGVISPLCVQTAEDARTDIEN